MFQKYGLSLLGLILLTAGIIGVASLLQQSEIQNSSLTAQVASTRYAPVGLLDGMAMPQGFAYGWAVDQDDVTKPLRVDFYVDAPVGNPANFAGSLTASDLSTDIPLSFPQYTGSHRFSFTIPARYRDGKTHAIYAYALDLTSGFTTLGGSPKMFTLAAPTPTPGPIAPLTPPTNLSVSCPTPGTSATLSWSPAAGVSGYYLRVFDSTLNPNRIPGQAGNFVFYNDNVTATSQRFTATPGHSYIWWIHSRNPVTGAPSTYVQSSVTCAVPTPTSVIPTPAPKPNLPVVAPTTPSPTTPVVTKPVMPVPVTKPGMPVSPTPTTPVTSWPVPQVFAFTQTARGGNISIAWNPISSAISFKIYRGDLLVAIVPNTGGQVAQVFDNGLTPGMQYSYKLKAVYANNNESVFSNVASAVSSPARLIGSSPAPVTSPGISPSIPSDSSDKVIGFMHHHGDGLDGNESGHVCGAEVPIRNTPDDQLFGTQSDSYCNLSSIELLQPATIKVLPAGPTQTFSSSGTFNLTTYNDQGTGVKIDTGKLVVLVSGIYDNELGFKVIKDKLNLVIDPNKDKIIYFGYGNGSFTSVNDIAINFNKWLVADAQNIKHYSKVSFISHSFGELVIRQSVLTASTEAKKIYSRTKIYSISPTLGGIDGALSSPCALPVFNERNPTCPYEYNNLYKAENITLYMQSVRGYNIYTVAGNPNYVGGDIDKGDYMMAGLLKARIAQDGMIPMRYPPATTCTRVPNNNPLINQTWLQSFGRTVSSSSKYVEYYVYTKLCLANSGTQRQIPTSDLPAVGSPFDGHSFLMTYVPLINEIAQDIASN